MSGVRCFSVRRLDPFDGLTQVVQIPHARAFSRDGEAWQVQVEQMRSPAGRYAQENAAPTASYLNTAIWTRRQGLCALPLDPMFELSTVKRLREDSERLAEHLAARIDSLPFVAADSLELWLLEARSGLPLALLDSRLPGNTPPLSQRARWTAGATALDSLDQLVRDNAGPTPATAWVQRDTCGAGEVRSASVPTPDGFSAELLPPLMIREDWADADQQALVEDYLRARAPLLLMLHGLSHAVRARLEAWAAGQALEVARWHHLYPEVAESRWIHKALVEAELRRSRADARSRPA